MTRYQGNSGQFERISEDTVLTEPPVPVNRYIPENNKPGNPAQINNTIFPSLHKLKLPFNLNFDLTASDIVLALLFFYLYLQTKDWEFLVLLAALIIL